MSQNTSERGPCPISLRPMSKQNGPTSNAFIFYFPLAAPFDDMNVWWTYAKGLLDALVREGLKLDAKCSTDAARILRPPGTFNHKQTPPLPVFADDWPLSPWPRSHGSRSAEGGYSSLDFSSAPGLRTASSRVRYEKSPSPASPRSCRASSPPGSSTSTPTPCGQMWEVPFVRPTVTPGSRFSMIGQAATRSNTKAPRRPWPNTASSPSTGSPFLRFTSSPPPSSRHVAGM